VSGQIRLDVLGERLTVFVGALIGHSSVKLAAKLILIRSVHDRPALTFPSLSPQEQMSMPDVSSIGNGAVGPIGRSTPSPSLRSDSTQRAPGRTHNTPDDRVELSDHARLLDRLRQMPDVRTDRVAEIRAQIESGQYETENRLSSAIDALIDDVS
jgi:negative regulator of flagellin synthesis FlgM